MILIALNFGSLLSTVLSLFTIFQNSQNSHNASAFLISTPFATKKSALSSSTLVQLSNNDFDSNVNKEVYKYKQDPRDVGKSENSNLDLITINHLLNKRSEYKKKSHFQKADSIRDYLQSEHGVSINDKTLMWSTQWKSKQKKTAKKQNFGMQKSNDKKAVKGVRGEGYKQIGGSLDTSKCRLTKEEIEQLLKARSQARRRRDFKRSDDLLQQLRMEGVVIDDTLKLWRADGHAISNNLSNDKALVNTNLKTYSPYKKSKHSKLITKEEETYIQRKINERIEAKILRNFYAADDIRDELRYLKHVEINDDERTWTVVDESKIHIDQSLREYEFGGKRNLNLSEDELDQIREKLKKRMEARKQKDFDVADNILRDLSIIHGVRVDDKKKLWHFDSSSVVTKSRQIFHQKKDNVSPSNIQKNQKIKTDWSVVENESFPDGISLADDSIPDGISIVDDSIPDGISIPEEILHGHTNDSLMTSVPREDSVQTNDSVSRQNAAAGSDDIDLPEGISIIDEKTLSNTISGSANESKHRSSAYTNSYLQSLTIPSLKDILRESGLPVSGRKLDLITRILDNA